MRGKQKIVVVYGYDVMVPASGERHAESKKARAPDIPITPFVVASHMSSNLFFPMVQIPPYPDAVYDPLNASNRLYVYPMNGKLVAYSSSFAACAACARCAADVSC